MRLLREEMPKQTIPPAEITTQQSPSGLVSRSIAKLVSPFSGSFSFLVKEAQCQTTGLNNFGVSSCGCLTVPLSHRDKRNGQH